LGVVKRGMSEPKASSAAPTLTGTYDCMDAWGRATQEQLPRESRSDNRLAVLSFGSSACPSFRVFLWTSKEMKVRPTGQMLIKIEI